MPNWTENDVTFVCKTKKAADQLKSLLESKEQKFDFNNITPMPIEIKETVSGSENCKPVALRVKLIPLLAFSEIVPVIIASAAKAEDTSATRARSYVCRALQRTGMSWGRFRRKSCGSRAAAAAGGTARYNRQPCSSSGTPRSGT